MKRLLAALLISASPVLSGPGLAFDISAMTEDEQAAFGQAVRDYLMANPEVLVESINVLEARQAEASIQNDTELVASHHDAIFDDGHSWIGGNPEGDLTMVAFIDYRCGVCRQFNDEIHDAVEDDGRIRLIVKEFPILGQDSEMSSRFAIAVLKMAGGEAYEAAHDALMTLRSPASPEALRGIADDLGIDAEAALALMDSDEVTEVLRQNHELANRMAIQGTPTFIIGDQMLRGVPRAGVAATIEQIRASL